MYQTGDLVDRGRRQGDGALRPRRQRIWRRESARAGRPLRRRRLRDARHLLPERHTGRGRCRSWPRAPLLRLCRLLFRRFRTRSISLATHVPAGRGRRAERAPGGALVQARRPQGPCRRAGRVRPHALRRDRRGPAAGRGADVAVDRPALEPRRSADPGPPRAGVLDRRRGSAAAGDGRSPSRGWPAQRAARRRQARQAQQ